MTLKNDPDRRIVRRVSGDSLAVGLRVKGRLSRMRGVAVDFNRYGAAVLLEQPVQKDKRVFLSLQYQDIRLDHLVGVVHNCVNQDDKYRVGIRFRTAHELQFDRELVEGLLLRLERLLEGVVPTPPLHEGAGFVLEQNQPPHPIV